MVPDTSLAELQMPAITICRVLRVHMWNICYQRVYAKYSLCDPELTSGGGDDTTDNPPTQRINTSLVIVIIALKHFQLRQELECLSWSKEIRSGNPLFQIFQILQILK